MSRRVRALTVRKTKVTRPYYPASGGMYLGDMPGIAVNFPTIGGIQYPVILDLETARQLAVRILASLDETNDY